MKIKTVNAYAVGIFLDGAIVELPLGFVGDLFEEDHQGNMEKVFMDQSLKYPEICFCVERRIEHLLPIKVETEYYGLSDEQFLVKVIQVRHLWKNGSYVFRYPYSAPNPITVGM